VISAAGTSARLHEHLAVRRELAEGRPETPIERAPYSAVRHEQAGRRVSR
jgi:hypothetical protein